MAAGRLCGLLYRLFQTKPVTSAEFKLVRNLALIYWERVMFCYYSLPLTSFCQWGARLVSPRQRSQSQLRPDFDDFTDYDGDDENGNGPILPPLPPISSSLLLTIFAPLP